MSLSSSSLLLVISRSIFLVFGGCCSNVFTFESLFQFPNIKDVGSFITFCQFVYIAIENMHIFFTQKRVIPIRVYVVGIVLFFLGSLGNNSALNYQISIPLHIVLRSFSPVITMVNESLILKKRYNATQVFSAFLLTSGCIITSLYKDEAFVWSGFESFFTSNSKNVTDFFTSTSTRSFTGLLILFGSSYLMSLLQIYNEWTYKTYGRGTWKEMIFYTHFLSIPLFFLTSRSSIWSNMQTIRQTYFSEGFKVTWSSFPVLLVGNLVTQSICVKGVNYLSSSTNALTLSIVLLLRKLVSLLLSLYVFGNKMTSTAAFGAALTFLGAILYSVGSSFRTQTKPLKAKRD